MMEIQSKRSVIEPTHERKKKITVATGVALF